MMDYWKIFPQSLGIDHGIASKGGRIRSQPDLQSQDYRQERASGGQLGPGIFTPFPHGQLTPLSLEDLALDAHRAESGRPGRLAPPKR